MVLCECGDLILCARGRGGGSDGRGEAWAVATLDDGTLDEPAASALAEYRWATFRLEVVLFLDGYWQEIARPLPPAAAGGRRLFADINSSVFFTPIYLHPVDSSSLQYRVYTAAHFCFIRTNLQKCTRKATSSTTVCEPCHYPVFL